jgi:hypothetical protein
MDGIGAIIEFAAQLHDHALVDVEPSRRDLFHNRAAIPGIDQCKAADGLANAHQVAVQVTRGTLLVVDEQDVAVAVHFPSVSATDNAETMSKRVTAECHWRIAGDSVQLLAFGACT